MGFRSSMGMHLQLTPIGYQKVNRHHDFASVNTAVKSHHGNSLLIYLFNFVALAVLELTL